MLKFDIYLKSYFIHIVNQFPSPLSLSLSLSLVLNISSLVYPDSSIKTDGDRIQILRTGCKPLLITVVRDNNTGVFPWRSKGIRNPVSEGGLEGPRLVRIPENRNLITSGSLFPPVMHSRGLGRSGPVRSGPVHILLTGCGTRGSTSSHPGCCKSRWEVWVARREINLRTGVLVLHCQVRALV